MSYILKCPAWPLHRLGRPIQHGTLYAFVALRPWLWKPVATLAMNSRKAAHSLSAHLERLGCHLTKPVIATTASAAPTAAANSLRSGGRE